MKLDCGVKILYSILNIDEFSQIRTYIEYFKDVQLLIPTVKDINKAKEDFEQLKEEYNKTNLFARLGKGLLSTSKNASNISTKRDVLLYRESLYQLKSEELVEYLKKIMELLLELINLKFIDINASSKVYPIVIEIKDIFKEKLNEVYFGFFKQIQNCDLKSLDINLLLGSIKMALYGVIDQFKLDFIDSLVVSKEDGYTYYDVSLLEKFLMDQQTLKKSLDFDAYEGIKELSSSRESLNDESFIKLVLNYKSK